MAKILWAFEISLAMDASTGRPKRLDTAAFSSQGGKVGFMGAANRIAIPFEVSIKPRSQERIDTIKREYSSVQPLLSQFN